LKSQSDLSKSKRPYLKNKQKTKLGDRDQEDHGSRPEDPHLQNNQSKMDWGAAQAVQRLLCKRSPEFKPQSHQNKKNLKAKGPRVCLKYAAVA
jgi:hypothetical protein